MNWETGKIKFFKQRPNKCDSEKCNVVQSFNCDDCPPPAPADCYACPPRPNGCEECADPTTKTWNAGSNPSEEVKEKAEKE
jgi:hypothetical protein